MQQVLTELEKLKVGDLMIMWCWLKNNGDLLSDWQSEI